MVGVYFSAQLLGSRPAVPAYLFHVIVEFDAVSVRVEGVGRIVNTRVQLRRDNVSFNPHAVSALESHGGPELLVVGELKAEGHVGGLWAKAQFFAPRLWEKAERMMLVVAAKESTTFALPLDFFCQSKAGDPLVPAHRVLVVVDK